MQATFSDSEAYELQMGRWSRRLADSFLDFAGVSNGEAVLDVGCGTGSLTFALLKRANVRSVKAVDLAPSFIEHARSRNKDAAVEFLVADACDLPFASSSFDRVLSLLCLHFIPDAHAAINQLVRVARPGGTVAAAVWDARGGFVAQRLFYDTAAMLDEQAVSARAQQLTRPLCRPGELENAWRAAGIRNVVATQLVTRMEYESFDDFWLPYLGGQGGAAAYVATLTEGQREILRESLRSAYLDGEINGPRSYAAVAWAVKGLAPE
jgi:SAM-dependent methyltransferase